MPGASTFFSEIQQAVVDILDADAAFDDIPLLVESLGDLDNAIDIVMNKLGICLIVETPFANITKPNLPGVQFEGVPVRITVWEDTTLNRPTGDVNQKHFMELAIIALYLLIHTMPRNPAGEQVATQFYAANPTLVDLRGDVDRAQFPNIQGVQINLLCTCGFAYAPQVTLLDGNNQALLDSMGIRLTTDRPFSRT